MSYLVREDGQRFVIPSYRDVLSGRQKSQLKKDILLLSQSYGEYITLQRKNAAQYEVAFSPDRGYLLGESVWQHFKRPSDMVYCEAVPNTTEAILVIVKSGSVYLDGRFPLEAIAEELVIFLTQKNHFDIYIYGDVPISEKEAEGKFTFDAESVKSFNRLTQPVFANLPLLKIYELQLVDPVLKSQGIGVLPVKQVLMLLTVVVVGWAIYTYFSSRVSTEIVTVIAPIETNPLQEYKDLLTSPAPDILLNQVVDKLTLLSTLPGWRATSVKFTKENVVAKVNTPGSKIQTLFDWGKQNDAAIEIKADGIEVTLKIAAINKEGLSVIHPIQEIIAKLVDSLSSVYPGNNLSLTLTNKTNFISARMILNLNGISFPFLRIIAQQFKDLPVILQEGTLNITDGTVNGSIIFDALGSPT